MKSITIIAALTISSTANAITVHQVTSLADHGPGTLRAAVTSATAGDRVTFAPWLYEKTIRLDSEININKNLRIEGDINGDRRPDITLDGQHKTRLLTVSTGANVTIWGLILEHGQSFAGSAVLNLGTLTAQFCKINGNVADDVGGGIYSRGTLTIDHSSMRDNLGARGGAICVAKLTTSDAAETTITASTLAHNRGKTKGGAVYNYRGKFASYQSTYFDNRAQADGNNWEHNTSAKGAVLYDEGGNSEFVDSTLKNNKSAPLRNPELKKCSFSVGKGRCSKCACKPEEEVKEDNKNKRMNNGGTIYNHGTGDSPAVKLIRTVIANSRGRNCAGLAHFTLEHAWSDDNTCDGAINYSGPGVSRGNAKLGSIADNGGYTYTIKPLPNSGLIDAGGTICAIRDQRGAPRKRYPNTHCDIGAIETNAHPPTRLRPQSINTTPPAEHNEDLAVLHKRITAQQADISAKTETITAQQADINAKTTTITTQQADIEAKTTTITVLQSDLQILNRQLANVQKRITKKDGDMAQLEEQAEELERQIANHQAHIAELEAPDELEATIGDAGEIKRLVLNGQDILHESETTVKIGPTTQQLKNTITEHIHDRKDGRTVSAGEISGQNGTIHWEIMTETIPGTNWHVSRWEFSSAQAFGNVSIGIYADLDIGQYTNHNGLIVGGTDHPNRLLITDRTKPTEGVALGLRSLKNASRMGWVGSPDIYHGRNGEVLDESILTGAYSGWGSFPPVTGAHGYGPADIAVAMGISLKPSAKLASFEITLVGAPTGTIE